VNLDINVTSTCNLGCKYCSEGHNPEMPDLAKIENSKTDVKTQDIIKFIAKVLEKKPDEIIDISFWGGEPMMNMNYCLDLMAFYAKKKNVKFFFYTNGTYINKFRDQLKAINKMLGQNHLGQNRLSIQISYDGKPINDIERLTKKNGSTSDLVKEAFAVLGEIGVQRSIKSTITPRTFHLIYESFLDVISIPGNSNYFPTPDTYSDYVKEDVEQYMEDLKLGLAKIARHIYEHKLPVNSFGWFQNSRALCSAGINYFSINLDGAISPCHGTMYEDHLDHEIGNIYDENIIAVVDQATEKYKGLIGHMNDDCQGCKSLFCMKCPAGSYNLPSTKEIAKKKIEIIPLDQYEMKWTTKNVNLCRIFKLNDVIHKSLLTATKSQPVQAEKKACEVRF
jgi:radical SAM protein with 4Fe4S-binding SPASM domain